MSDNPTDDVLKDFNEQEQQEIRRANLGMEAESFMSSNLYRYIASRAQMEFEEKMKELVTCPADDVSENTRLRSEIKVYIAFEDWLKEAVSSGKNAEQSLNAMDATDK